MAVPTSTTTWFSLLTAIAEKLGIAEYPSDSLALPPFSSAFNFALCKRIAADAMQMFISDAPEAGWRWQRRLATITFAPAVTGVATSGTSTTLVCSTLASLYADDYFNGCLIRITAGVGLGQTATITDYTGLTGSFAFTALSGGSTPTTTTEFTICASTSVINADAARYLMPEDFSGEAGDNITYAAASNKQLLIQVRDESFLRQLRADNPQTGTVQYVAFRPYQPTAPILTAGRRWEMLCYPTPGTADTIEIPYTMNFGAIQMEGGIATGGGATSVADTTRTEPDDYFNGWTVTIVDGTGKGSNGVVTDYATGTFTVADWLSTYGAAGGVNPTLNSAYMVEPYAPNVHPAGQSFDYAVKCACLAQCEMESDESLDTHCVEIYQKKALPASHRIDARMAPHTLGMSGEQPEYKRTWNPITSFS